MDQVTSYASHHLVVDGTDQYGNFDGAAEQAPFVVFDVDLQENIAGPFASRAGAQLSLAFIKRGGAPALDVEAMLRYNERRYMGEWSGPIPAPIQKAVKRLRVWGQQLLARVSHPLASN